MNLYTEVVGVLLSVFVSVVIIGGWTYWRERQQLRSRLRREAGSRSNNIAIAAIEQLRDKNWLVGDQGVLKGANLHYANLHGADLSWANLEDADMAHAILSDATFVGTELQSADLRFTELRGALLTAIDLSNSKLSVSNLSFANMMSVNLEGADLRNADMSHAILRGVNLQNADLAGAILDGAQLIEVQLDGATLPDQQAYSTETGVDRFTNPRHPRYPDALNVFAEVRLNSERSIMREWVNSR